MSPSTCCEYFGADIDIQKEIFPLNLMRKRSKAHEPLHKVHVEHKTDKTVSTTEEVAKQQNWFGVVLIFLFSNSAHWSSE